MLELTIKIIIFISLYIITFYVLALFKSEYKTKQLKKYPDVTILVPAYNEETGIARTIDSCLNLNYSGKINILVVDDCSKDNTVKIVIVRLKLFS